MWKLTGLIAFLALCVFGLARFGDRSDAPIVRTATGIVVNAYDRFGRAYDAHRLHMHTVQRYESQAAGK
jgi:hypothetical protein